MRVSFPYPKLVAGVVAGFIVLAMPLPVMSRENNWSEFSFDSSSDSYLKRGERSFDLSSRQYVTTGYTRTHSGDFITIMEFNPDSVMLRTSDWIKILFSAGAEYDTAVDEEAEQTLNSVPVHFGQSYVGTFGERTYTIKLDEESLAFPALKAKFLYRPGGVLKPEHEPRNPTSRTEHAVADEAEPSEEEALAELPPAGGQMVDNVTVTVKTGPPDDEENPREGRLKLTLSYRYEGGDATLTRQAVNFEEGETRDFIFHNIPAATYDAEVNFRGKTIKRKVDVKRSGAKIPMSFPGAEEWEELQKAREQVARQHGPCGDGCQASNASGQPRPVDRRGLDKPVKGFVRFIHVCVTTPRSEGVSTARSDLSVELRGPKHFMQTEKDIRPGTSNMITLLTFPVGTYDVIAKYAGVSVSDTVNLQADCVDIALAFPEASETEQEPAAEEEPERVDTVTVTVTIPSAGGYGTPKSYPLTLSLNGTTEGGFASMHRDTLAVAEGETVTYTFNNVLPGAYGVTITYGDRTIASTIDISPSDTEFNLLFR